MTLHTLSNELGYQLQKMIVDTSNNNPAPKMGVITDVSDDYCYANISLDGGTISGVECFGYPKIGSKCIIIFIDGSYDHMLAICNPLNTYEGNLTPTYNILANGNFENGLTGWSGATLVSNDGFTSTHCCSIKPKSTLHSKNIDITELLTEEEGKNTPIMVSVFHKGCNGTINLTDQDNEKIVFTPYSMGINSNPLESKTDWSFQRVNFVPGNVETIKINIYNPNSEPNDLLYIDGVRVWRPDDNNEWYPSKYDI